MNPQEMKDAMDLAERNIRAKLEAIDSRFFPDGVAYDEDEIKDDGEFIGFVLDLQNRPSPEFSIWSFIPTVSPKLYAEMSTRFERAMSKTIGAGGGR